MALLILEKIKKSFKGIPVLDGADLKLNPGEKVGLVGRNGCGKTTLLHIAAGIMAPDDGQRSAAGNPTCGILAQTPHFGDAGSLFQAAIRAQTEINAIEEGLARTAAAMDRAGRNTEELERLIRRHAKMEERYRLLGGYARRGRVQAVLQGVGFKVEDLSRKPETLSGGETKRLQLAMILLGGFDILFLDEPGNHLDIAGTEWLTEFLRNWKGTVLIVSHDRYLLNGVVRRIVELDEGHTRNYRGDCDYFLRERRRLAEEGEKERKEQERIRIQGEDFIRRNFYGQKARQAKSKRKQLDRLADPETVRAHSHARFRFRESPDTGDYALRFKRLSAAFGERTLFKDLDLDLETGGTLGVIGPNGSGKSTLLRIILGLIPPIHGAVWTSPRARPVYFDQQLEGLGRSGSLLEEMRSVMPRATDGELRSHLARFLFRGDEVEKKLEKLSGGESSRALLGKSALQDANLLLLDEPTNHLDIYMRESLEEAIKEFTGATVIVSHDRRLLDGTVDKLLVLGGERPVLHLGNYSSYLESMKTKGAPSPRKPERPPVKAAKTARKRPSKRVKRHHTYEELEALIIAKEDRLREIDVEIYKEEVYMDHALSRKLEVEAERLRRELHDLYEEWNTWA